MDKAAMLSRRTLFELTGAALAVALPSASSAASVSKADGPIWGQWGAAEVRVDDGLLTVSTGRVERTWRWQDGVLSSVGLRDLRTDRVWTGSAPAWGHEAWLGGARGELRSLRAEVVRFDPYTSDHVRLTAEVAYPERGVELRFEATGYPDAPGIRTQLFVRASADGLAGGSPTGWVDALPVGESAARTFAFGYYNHTQGRNQRDTPILHEERWSAGEAPDAVGWANGLALEDDAGGLCVIKESHKCVNQAGVDTGAFVLQNGSLRNTGWGPSASDLASAEKRWCWASWVVVWSGGVDERELAIKQFDRARFPVDAARDIYVMANTWGSGTAKQESLEASREENILQQIESCRDLGIDVQQIDDGWQGDQYEEWAPVPPRYPAGWRRVRQAARDAGVRLGLWAAWRIGIEELVRSWDEGGFGFYKIDFARLETYQQVDGLFSKMRKLIEHSGHSLRVNWDVTENPARVGYYFARDLGNIYLENRKPMEPAHVVYVPYLVLRDAWHVAHYTNLNRFQITVQNVDRVNREVSNAYKHSHSYALAIALAGSPIFFQETTLLSDEARGQIRRLLALYRRERQKMFRDYVFAIGDEPDDASWPGFQTWDAESRSGYLLVFRELNSPDARRRIPLRFIANLSIELTDIETSETTQARVPANGELPLRIKEPASFAWLRYQVEN